MKEKVERNREKKIDYKEVILKTIFISTVLSVAMIAPNALKMFDFLKLKEKKFTNFYLERRSNQLIKKGYITVNKGGLELTDKGQQELLGYSDFQTKKPKKWDGLWTIISYDISDKKKNIRDSVRFQLKRIGFIQLQKSVWVFPYDCPELIYLIKTEWKLKEELVYIRAKYISREKKLKEYFDL